MLIPKKLVLSRQKTFDYLAGLEAASAADRTLYIPPGLFRPKIEELLEAIPEQLPANIIELAGSSPTGAALFWSQPRKCLILPPFPVMQESTSAGFNVKPLHSLLERELNIALVLIRLGSYAVGLCHGENLVSSKVGTGLVHARHHQGGSSQGRFARHREKQIEYFMTRVCEHVREQLEPQAQTIDYLVYGGSNTAILLLKKRCSFLEKFDNRNLPPLLDIPDPRKPVLLKAIERVWLSTVIEWREEIADLKRNPIV